MSRCGSPVANPDLVVVDDAGDEAERRRRRATISARASRSGCPRALKVQIEAAASSEGVSTNAWIVRALSRALELRRDKSRSGSRLQGFTHT